MLNDLTLTENEINKLKQNNYVVIERDGYTLLIKKGEIPHTFIGTIISYQNKK